MTHSMPRLFAAGHADNQSFGHYEIGTIYQAFMCAVIQPYKFLIQKLYVKVPLLHINLGQISDLPLSSGTGIQILCVLYYPAVIKAKTCNAVIVPGMCRFLSMNTALPLLIEFHDTESSTYSRIQ